MREEEREVVPAQVIEESHRWVTHYKCDSCGKEIQRDPPLEVTATEYAHELIVGLDLDECVSLYRRRDFCPQCLEPVWQAINALLGVEDPWVERDKEYDD